MGGLAALAREAGPPGDRLRRQRLPADERSAARARHRADRGLWRRAAGAEARRVRRRQRRHARADSADGGDPRRRRRRTPAARSGWPSTCCSAGMCWPWPARTARPPPPSMLAWMLEHAGLQPGFLVGGVPLNFGVSARLGGGRRFVIEADEYDTAFFDKRSKFVHYRPRTAILNNLEFDHADIFPDLAAIETQFHHLVRTVPASGRLVVNARDEALQRVLDARLLERGAALRRAQGGARRPARARRAACLRRAARQPEDRPRRLAAAGRAQPAQRAGGDRRGRACGRRARRRGRVRWRSFENVRAPPGAARRSRRREGLRRLRAPPDRDPHHRSTGCAAASGSAAHPGGVRAALEHDEARHDEGPAAVGAGRSRPVVLPAGRPRLGRRARRWRRWARRPCVADTIDKLVAAVVAAARPGDHVLCMSNGGFGGIHAKLLDGAARAAADADDRAPPPICSTCTASARRRSRSRRSAWPPGCSAPAARCSWWCPQLPPSPREAMRTGARGVARLADRAHGASSAARSAGSTPPWSPSGSAAARCCSIRPSNPARDLAGHIGEQTAFHDPDDHFFFRREYVDELRAMTPPRITRPDRYLAVIAKGDEVLDWREMRARYAGVAACARRRRRPRAVRLRRCTCPPSCCDFLWPACGSSRGEPRSSAVGDNPRPMYALFDDAGKFLAGRVMSEADARCRSSSTRASASRSSPPTCCCSFEQPAPAELIAQAQRAGRRDRPRPGLGVRARRRLRLRRPGARLLRRQGRRRAAGRGAVPPVRGAALLPPRRQGRSSRRRPKRSSRPRCSASSARSSSRRRSTPGPTSWSAGRCPAPVREQLYKILFKPDKNAPEYKAVVEAAQALAARAARPAEGRRRHHQRLPVPLEALPVRALPARAPASPALAAPPIKEDLPLAAVQAFSIDDSATTEIDDALSVQGLGSGTVMFGIHIAAPGLAIAPDSGARQGRARARCPPSTCRAGS